MTHLAALASLGLHAYVMIPYAAIATRVFAFPQILG
jgi:hypothetical protein